MYKNTYNNEEKEPLTKEMFLKITHGGKDILEKEFGCGLPSKDNFKYPYGSDTNASVSINEIDGKWLFNDFGDLSRSGDVFNLLGDKYNLDPHKDLGQIIDKAGKEYGLLPELPKLKRGEDFSYWNRYGINESTTYVYPINWYISGTTKYGYTKPNPIFGFDVFRDGSAIKVYRPLTKTSYKHCWIGDLSGRIPFSQYITNESDDRRIVVVEGHKDCYILAQYIGGEYDIVGLDNIKSAIPNKVLELDPKNRILLLDNDDEGKHRSNRECEESGFMQIFTPEQWKDISDYVEALVNEGKEFEEIQTILKAFINTAWYVPGHDQQDYHKKWYTLGELMKLEDEIPYLVRNDKQGLIPKVGLIAIVGGSDVGKSTFLRQLGLSIVGGKEFVGYEINATYNRVVYVTTEDDAISFRVGLNKQMGGLNIKVTSDIEDKYIIVIDQDDLYKTVSNILKKYPADLIVLDAFGDIYTDEMNQANRVRGFLHPYRQLAIQHECVIAFLHHINKAGQDKLPNKKFISGSHAFENKMRLVLELRDGDDVGKKHLTILKGNYIPREYKLKSMTLDFNEDALIFTSDGTWGIDLNTPQYSSSKGLTPSEVNQELQKSIRDDMYSANGTIKFTIAYGATEFRNKLRDVAGRHDVYISTTTDDKWLHKWLSDGLIIDNGKNEHDPNRRFMHPLSNGNK